jgi:hypothetical protein
VAPPYHQSAAIYLIKEEPMFGKLKAGNPLLQKAIDKVGPTLQPHIDQLLTLSPATVKDDAQFGSLFVKPAALATAAALGGATALIPQFDERFAKAMTALRDELLVLDGERVALVGDYQERLPQVLADALKS